MIKWIIIFLLVANPCFGADVLGNFSGFESQSLLDAQVTSGSPAFSTSIKKSGESSLEMAGAATLANYRMDVVFDSGGVGITLTAGDYITVGVHFYATDVTPGTTQAFLVSRTSGAEQSICLELEADGDLVITGQNCGTVLSTITTPFSINTWYFIELQYLMDDSGTCELFIDGVDQSVSCSGDMVEVSDVDIGSLAFLGGVSGDGTWYFDNAYVLYDDADTAYPTPLAESSAGVDVFAY